MYKLKYLPWRELFQIAIIATLILIPLELLVGWGYSSSPIVRQIIQRIYTPPLNTIVYIAAAVGVGALAVYIGERRRVVGLVNNPSLWALVLCVMLGLLVKSLLPIPSILVNFRDFGTLIGVVFGVFGRAKKLSR
ncbi:MAG: peptide chain release factor 1 [Oscillatoria sp. SIO1A7]|nr:peptide chain release factor 1 [Oscillatoria sp. SIO1A7]